jgi:5-methylcytosine-specific restriction endonuclease McrA
MPYTQVQLRQIYDRTDGYCHLCHCKLSINNYARPGQRGAWEVEHSRARAQGGTNHGNNLKPACIPCNRGKGTLTTRTVRGWNGLSKAPYSKVKKQALRRENTTAGGLIGATFGLVGGLPGAVIGAVVGALIGDSIKPPKAG